MPSLHACSEVFNGMDVVSYLKTCFDIVTGNEVISNESLENFTVIGLGRFHTVRSILNWKSIKKDRDRASVLWWKYAVVFLTTMTDWSVMITYLRSLFKVLLIDVGDVESEVKNGY